MKTHPVSTKFSHRLMGWLAGASAICVAAISLGGASAQEPEPPGATLAYPAPETLDVDASRFTEQSLDWFDRQCQRWVPAKLHLATKAVVGSVPLVVFSHGIGGSRDGYSYLGRYFAAHGYGSLHVQHVDSDLRLWFGNPLALSARLSDAARSSEALDRALDLRYALDEILSAEQGALFDTRRIAAAGHSYGANTTMLIAGAQVERQGHKVTLRDPRISAAILISALPFLSHGGPQQNTLGHRRSDVAHHSHRGRDSDPGLRLPYPGSHGHLQCYGQRPRRAQVLAVFKDGSHSIFTDRAGPGGLHFNRRVKIATRQWALAFLNGISASNYRAMDAWPLSSAELVAQFEKRVP